MKYESTNRFDHDFARLDARSRALFMGAVRALNEAYEHYLAGGRKGTPAWPKHLRVASVIDARGVFELTWSFAGPDGRATFEFIEIDEELAIRWRRIGGHEIFKIPEKVLRAYG